MVYAFLRRLARIALRAYYADIVVVGQEHVPARGPVVIVSNHPNALVDALLIATAVDRQVFITARASLFEQRLFSAFLEHIGVIPLLRAQDVPTTKSASGFLARNTASLSRAIEVLKEEGTLLIFPEGVSHDVPRLAPLRSGTARIATQAVGMGVKLQLLPIGLIYEAKERPRSRVLVRIGAPVDVPAWSARHLSTSPASLTQEILRQLGRVSLQFATGDRAAAAYRFARALQGLRRAANTREGQHDISAADRIGRMTEALMFAPSMLQNRVDRFAVDVSALGMQFDSRGLTVDGLLGSQSSFAQPPTVIRDVLVTAILLPLVLLGQVVLWVPQHAAHFVALRGLRNDQSKDQPAMRTILMAFLTVPAWYGIVLAALLTVVEPVVAFSCLLMGLVSSALAILLRDRAITAGRRLRSRITGESGSAFRASALSTARSLLGEAHRLDELLQKAVQEDR